MWPQSPTNLSFSKLPIKYFHNRTYNTNKFLKPKRKLINPNALIHTPKRQMFPTNALSISPTCWKNTKRKNSYLAVEKLRNYEATIHSRRIWWRRQLRVNYPITKAFWCLRFFAVLMRAFKVWKVVTTRFYCVNLGKWRVFGVSKLKFPIRFELNASVIATRWLSISLSSFWMPFKKIVSIMRIVMLFYF